MIGTIFILLASIIIDFISFIFPTSSGFSTEIITSMEWLAGYAMILDPLVSMDAIFFAIVSLVTFELIVLSFRLITWLISYIPMFGGQR